MTNLPKDPVMLLSFVNLKLRDQYPDIDSLCEDMNVDRSQLLSTLSAIDYEYDAGSNQFK